MPRRLDLSDKGMELIAYLSLHWEAPSGEHSLELCGQTSLPMGK